MRKQPNSRMCFICGRQNPVGLKLDFYEDHEAEQVLATFSVPDEFQGYPGVAHGGIVSAILDEVAGRAVLLHGTDEDLMATLRLTIRYRHPTPTETELTAVGWIERMSGVGAQAAAEIRLPDGTVTAECEVTLVRPPEEIRKQWEPEKQYWKIYKEGETA